MANHPDPRTGSPDPNGADATHPLRVWREAAGLTGAALGALIGVTKSTISGYESGQRIPRRKILINIRNVTNGFVTADDFIRAEAAE
jgi:transcriptional regulator with XRE-family HTH domain